MTGERVGTGPCDKECEVTRDCEETRWNDQGVRGDQAV